DEARVQGLVAGSAARDERHPALGLGVGAVHDAVFVVDAHLLGALLEPDERIADDVLRIPDELLHRSPPRPIVCVTFMNAPSHPAPGPPSGGDGSTLPKPPDPRTGFGRGLGCWRGWAGAAAGSNVRGHQTASLGHQAWCPRAGLPVASRVTVKRSQAKAGNP